MPPAAFDALQKAEFAGFSFPTSEIKASCKMRDHVHVYPHSPGGAPEKLGRDLYEFRFRCPFKQGFKKYPNLWPETLASLRIIFEGGRSFDLVVPTIGTITAYCTSWEEVANPQKDRNGVDVDLVFREDQSEMFLVDKLVTKTVTNYQGAVQAYKTALNDQKGRKANALASLDNPDALMMTGIPVDELSALDEVLEVAEQVLGAVLTGVAFGLAIAELAAGLVALCRQVDAVSIALQDPTRSALVDALHGIWIAAQQIQQQATTTNVKRIDYEVPQLMSVADISRAIWGDSSHAMELLQGNNLPNPFAVKAGTSVKAYVFDNTTTLAAAS